jgi:hypothetical protein
MITAEVAEKIGKAGNPLIARINPDFYDSFYAEEEKTTNNTTIIT